MTLIFARNLKLHIQRPKDVARFGVEHSHQMSKEQGKGFLVLLIVRATNFDKLIFALLGDLPGESRL